MKNKKLLFSFFLILNLSIFQNIFSMLPETEKVRKNVFIETEEAYPDYLLLPDLLNLNLDEFKVKFKRFALSRISFYDFNKEQPGRSLYFFFAGLLSVLKGSDYSVKIRNENIEKSLYSIFYIYKNEKLFLKIHIKGVTKEVALSKDFAIHADEFLNDIDEDVSFIKILYNKHNILIESYKKNPLKDKREIPFLFKNFDLFRRSFKKVVKDKKYLNGLWKNYKKPLSFSSEMDFHLFLYGMINNVNNLDYLNSNVERGRGRLDIMTKYKNKEGKLVKYVIELKKTGSLEPASIKQDLIIEDLKIEHAFKQIESAFKQVESRGYALYTPSKKVADKIIVAVINLNLKDTKISLEEKEYSVGIEIKPLMKDRMKRKRITPLFSSPFKQRRKKL
ncbi:hypothetical protein GF385_04695 [Candidatus Dependentiae bacterium]|nr:hypothetical protein [Candidatus Dependentiae bacterium]